MAKDKRSYGELLQDPRWQRKRLEILQRDKWSCQACGSKTDTLHVHHQFYVSGLAPWEYEPHQLVTLCKGCHDGATAQAERLRESLTWLSPLHLEQLRGYIDAAVSNDTGSVFSIESDQYRKGVCDFFRLSPGDFESIQVLESRPLTAQLVRAYLSWRKENDAFGDQVTKEVAVQDACDEAFEDLLS